MHNIMYFNRCSSAVGRIGGYIQRISIGNGCFSLSTVVHEIGHAVGFWHEQSRPDRDKYVNIHDENIQTGREYNFNKRTDIDSLGVTHDFNSVMHYSSTAFAKHGTVTISAKEKDVPFGRVPELSPLDIKQANLLYKRQCGK